MARSQPHQPEPLSEERFEAAVKQLLATPPQPKRAKKPPRKSEPKPKRKPR